MVFLRVAAAAAVVIALRLSSQGPGPHYSEWSTPENLGPSINTTATEAGGAVSKDGLSLYFHSNRPGGLGGTDLYVSQRNNLNAPWGVPVPLVAVNSSAGDAEPTLSRDEHWLFFNSARPGGVGGIDLWASYREHTHDDLGWQPPVNLGDRINSLDTDTGAAYFENDEGGPPQLLFSSNRSGGLGAFDLYISELEADGKFGPATLIAELSSSFSEPGLSIRFDGLEVFFFSGRPTSTGGLDLWSATRRTIFDPWSAPGNLSELNSAVNDVQPHIAPDRETLYFSSMRPGGFGGMDLYVTTRVKQRR